MAATKSLKISDRAAKPIVRINKSITPKAIEAKGDTNGFKCVCCGKVYNKQKNSFPVVHSVLWKANDDYAPICRACVKEYYNQIKEYFCGDEFKAMERICGLLDLYWDSALFDGCIATETGLRDPFIYFAKYLRTSADVRRTYLDTAGEDRSVLISDAEDFDRAAEKHSIEITEKQRERWGIGWQADEYELLDGHYHMLQKKSVNPDEQEQLIMQLCEIYVLQYRARVKGDIGEYEKTAKLYKTYYDSGGFRSGLNEDDSFRQPLGVTTMIVEGISPAEYYKDKKLFRDYDGIGDYWQRFIVRPFKNFITGSKEMDEEFVIKDGDEQ